MAYYIVKYIYFALIMLSLFFGSLNASSSFGIPLMCETFIN